MTLPYTWTSPDGTTVMVDEAIGVWGDAEGACAEAPRGDAAIALAGAVLDAGGVECSIIPLDELARLTRERDRLRLAWTSARRGRAKATSGVDYLLGEVDTAMKAVDQLVKERDRFRARVGVLEERQRYSDAARAQAAQSMRERAADAARSAVVVDRELSLGEQRAAIVAAIRGLGPLVPVVHADLPEAVTPCGLGTRDVTTGTHVSEVSCLDCLRTLAATRVGDQLPAEDLIEPGDEVPTLCELDARLAAVEQALAARPRLIMPPGAPTPAQLRDTAGDLSAAPAEPTRCESILRTVTGYAKVRCILTAGHDGIHRGDGRIWDTPIIPAMGAEYLSCGATIDRPDGTTYTCARRVAHEGGCGSRRDDAPCEVCGLAAADQEHGPGGRCRHTPATRLGRPGGDQ